MFEEFNYFSNFGTAGIQSPLLQALMSEESETLNEGRN